jgi:hypothetical protein
MLIQPLYTDPSKVHILFTGRKYKLTYKDHEIIGNSRSQVIAELVKRVRGE